MNYSKFLHIPKAKRPLTSDNLKNRWLPNGLCMAQAPIMVERRGIEPLASRLRTLRSPS